MRSLSLTQGAMRLLSEALKGFGLVGVGALGFDRRGQDCHVWSDHRALRPGEVHDDKKPEECEQDELTDKMM